MDAIDYIQLLNDLKELIEKQIHLPPKGEFKQYTAQNINNKRQKYTINITQYKTKKGQESKFSLHAMCKSTKQGLLRLDVGDTIFHKNINGDIIRGTHLHVFADGMLSDAIAFDHENDNIVELCLKFMERLKVVDVSSSTFVVMEQLKLVN